MPNNTETIKDSEKLTRYKSKNFMIEIVETEDSFEFWLGCMESWVSKFIFGYKKKQKDGVIIDFDTFKRMINDSLEAEKQRFVEEICGMDTCDYNLAE